MSEWTKRDQARLAFFMESVALFRRMDSDHNAVSAMLCMDHPQVESTCKAWRTYADLIDQEEARDLNSVQKPLWFDRVLQIVFFWRMRKGSGAQRRATAKAVKGITPPAGGGGPWR